MNKDMTIGLLKQLRHAEVMKAFVEGAEVQHRDPRFGTWSTTNNPTWRTDLEYRVKPDPRVIYVLSYNLRNGITFPQTITENQYKGASEEAKKRFIKFIEAQD